MKKKTIFKFGVGLMGVGLLSGCGSGENAGDSKTTTISLMSNETETLLVNWQEKVIEDFEEQNPDIKIEVQRMSYDDYIQSLQTKFASGDLPTVFQVENIYLEKYVDNEYVMDISDSVAKDYYDPEQLVNLSLNDKLYALPYNTNVVGVTYNKELFENAGIDEIPDTLDEFYDACEKLEESGVTPIVSGYQESWAIMADLQADYVNSVLTNDDQSILNLVDRSETFADSKPWQNVYQRLQERRQYMQSDLFGTSWDAACTMVANDEAAMVVSGQWAGNNIKEYDENIELGMFPLPVSNSAEDSKFVVQSATAGLGISSVASEKEQEAALKFLEYYHSPEVAETYAVETTNICVVKGVEVPDTSVVYDIVEDMNAGNTKNFDGNINFPNEERNAVETLTAEFMLEPDSDLQSTMKSLDSEFDRIAAN